MSLKHCNCICLTTPTTDRQGNADAGGADSSDDDLTEMPDLTPIDGVRQRAMSVDTALSQHRRPRKIGVPSHGPLTVPVEPADAVISDEEVGVEQISKAAGERMHGGKAQPSRVCHELQ